MKQIIPFIVEKAILERCVKIVTLIKFIGKTFNILILDRMTAKLVKIRINITGNK